MVWGEMMTKTFFLTLSLFLALWGFAAETKAEKLQQIEERIQQLEDEKRGYEAKAIRHEDQADYLLFDDQTFLEARRHMQLADENRAKAAAIQMEIDRLQAEKEKMK
jgi:hypothetical protein